MEHIIEGSLARLVDHGSLEPVILAIQDSTTLNYAGRPATERLSHIGGGGVSGLTVHLGLAVNGTGRPLGVYNIDTANDSERAELASQRWGHGLERAEMAVEVTAHGGRHARAGRQAKVALRATWVQLLPPDRQAKAAPIRMLAVSATEVNPPAGVEPLHWVLLTTEGDITVDAVKRIVGWYTLRWTIEEFFRTLKTDTRIEDHRLTHADELGKCLAFDAITTCHVYSLHRLAREQPELAAAEVVGEDELVMLDVKLAGHGMKPTDTGEYRNMHGFVVDVARLAGFRPRRSQPLPGVSKLWEGYKILREATHSYQSLRAQNLIKDE